MHYDTGFSLLEEKPTVTGADVNTGLIMSANPNSDCERCVSVFIRSNNTDWT